MGSVFHKMLKYFLLTPQTVLLWLDIEFLQSSKIFSPLMHKLLLDQDFSRLVVHKPLCHIVLYHQLTLQLHHQQDKHLNFQSVLLRILDKFEVCFTQNFQTL